MKLTFGLLAVATLCAAGCASVGHLSADQRGRTIAKEFHAARASRLTRLNAPCEIEVHSAARMSGRVQSAFGHQNVSYPFKPLLSAALESALYEVFVPPGRDVLKSFKAEVDVHESRLTVSGGGAQYRIKLLVCLRHPNGRIIHRERIDKGNRSPFNGNALPDAFWRTIYEAAYDYAREVSQDRVVRQTAAPRDPSSEVEAGTVSSRLGALVTKALKTVVHSAASSKGSTLAVTNVRTNITGDSTMVNFVTAEMEGSSLLRESFILVERSRIKDVLAELERQRNLIYDQQTVAEIGKLVNAKHLLTADLFLLDGVLTLFVKIVDVEHGVTISSARSAVRVQ